MTSTKNIAILGSTGSIGRSALDVVRHVDGLNVVALSGFQNLQLLQEQAAEFEPLFVVAADETLAARSEHNFGSAELLLGTDSLNEIATHPEVDIVLAAIVGSAGLESTWEAVAAGKTVALANKETMVVAGHLMTELAKQTGAEILPVDSEHSAIFQALTSGKDKEVSKITLTASGGPFREWTQSDMQNVSVEQALAHPTWDMGRKITIDSATMMNKALELIEAKWLFNVSASQLAVTIHPQSIVHSLVEFRDGSTMAQLSPPDMKLPIQYALTYPDRVVGPAPQLDWSEAIHLDFIPPDFEKFPALDLGFEVVKFGGTTGAVLNAANEAAVQAFLDRTIPFHQITTACREILEHHHFEPRPNLPQLKAVDQWARQEISKWIFA